MIGMLLGIAFVLVVVFIPHISIWALNVLFHLNIGHGLAEWFAVLWLFGIGASAKS